MHLSYLNLCAWPILPHHHLCHISAPTPSTPIGPLKEPASLSGAGFMDNAGEPWLDLAPFLLPQHRSHKVTQAFAVGKMNSFQLFGGILRAFSRPRPWSKECPKLLLTDQAMLMCCVMLCPKTWCKLHILHSVLFSLWAKGVDGQWKYTQNGCIVFGYV